MVDVCGPNIRLDNSHDSGERTKSAAMSRSVNTASIAFKSLFAAVGSGCASYVLLAGSEPSIGFGVAYGIGTLVLLVAGVWHLNKFFREA